MIFLKYYPNYLFSEYIFMSSGYSGKVSDDKQITVMPVWGPGFEVSLDFYIHSLVEGNSNGFSWMFAIRYQHWIMVNS